jgi:acyl-CoA synthetase (AMP-forming)/AMP-acid ligase II
MHAAAFEASPRPRASAPGRDIPPQKLPVPGLLMPNGIEWATVALAVMRVGAVPVPVSTLLRPPELLAQLAPPPSIT